MIPATTSTCSPVRSRARLAALALAACCAAAPSHARADTWLWIGGASPGNGLWSAAANWTHIAGPSSSAIPLNSQDTTVNFAGSLNPSPIQDIANPLILNSLTFQSSAAAFTLLGNGLEFATSSTSVAPTIIQNSANAPSVLTTIALNNTLTISGSGAGALSLLGTVSGNAAIVNNFAGTLALASANSYNGGTTLNGGQVNIGTNTSFGTGTVTFNTGTILATGNLTISNNIPSIGSSTSFQAASGVTLVVNPGSSQFGNLNFGSATNNGIVNFEPASFTYFGGTINVNGGTLLDGADSLSQTLQSYHVVIANSATFKLNGFSTTINNLTGQGTLDIGTNSSETFTLTSATFQGVIIGSGRLITTGNTVLLRGSNSYTGGTTLGGGTVGAGNNFALSTGAVTVSANTNLYADNDDRALSNLISINAAKALTIQDDPNAVHNLTLSGVISGSGALVMSGSGTLAIRNSNTYSGGTTLNSGQIVVSNNNSFGTGTLTINGGVIVASSTVTISNNFTTTTSTPMDFEAAPGTTLTLNSASATFGNINFGSATNNGTVIFFPFSEIDSGGTINVNGGTLLSGGTLLARLIPDYSLVNIAAGATLNVNGNSTSIQNLTGAGTFATASGSGNTFSLIAANFSGTISGSGRLVTNAGTIVLSGSNSFTGGSTFAGGTVGAGNNSALGPNAVTVSANTNLYAAGTNVSLTPLITIDTGKSLIIQDDPNDAHNLTLSGVISGSGVLVMSASGSLTLPASNTFSGGSTLNNGQIIITNNNSLGTGQIFIKGGTITATSNATINNNYDNSNATAPTTFQAAAGVTLTLGGIARIGDGTLNFGSASNTGTVNFSTNLAGIGLPIVNVNGGTLFNGTGSLPTVLLGDIVSIAQFAKLDLNGASVNLDTLLGAGTLATGTAVETFTLANASFSGTITGTGKLITTGNTITLSGPNTYTGGSIFGGGNVGAGNNAALGTAAITVTANTSLFAQGADHALSNAITINTGKSLTIQNDTTTHNLTLSGTITGPGSLVMNGTGTLTLAGAFSYSGGTSILNGTLQFIHNGSTNPITGAGRLFVGSTTLGAATVTINATNSLNVVNALTIASNSELNLTNNDLLVHNSTLAAIVPLIVSGNTVSQNGPGIVTTTALSNPGQGLGVLTGGQYLTLHPGAAFDSNAVLSTDVLIKYTYQGDANLDGRITADDYLQLDSAFLRQSANPTWFNGDFNYDGTINALDYALIDFAFAHQSGSLADALITLHTAQFGQPYKDALAALQSAAIPEPASLSTLALATLPLLTRRRQKRQPPKS